VDGTIVTARLRLSPIADPGDATLVAFLADDRVMSRLRHGPLAGEAACALLDEYAQTWQRRGFGVWRLDDIASGEFVGLCGLVERPDLGGVALTCAIGVPHQARGYGREAMAAAIEFGFDRAGLAEILGVARETNRASQRLMESLGMRSIASAISARGNAIRRFAIRRTQRDGRSG